MHISSVIVRNFRNLLDLEIRDLGPAAVIVGENNVGKSNLLYALRLVLDPTLPETSRDLDADDFWEGLAAPFAGNQIQIVIELTGFDADESAKAVMADAIVGVAPFVARFTYIYRPSPGVVGPTSTREDYEHLVFAGLNEANRLRPEVRRLVSVHVLPALRDAESDLASWTKSPMRTLLEGMSIDPKFLDALIADITTASETLLSHKPVADLEAAIAGRLIDLVGQAFSPEPTLGIGASRSVDVLRAVRVFVESGRALGTTGLGSSNLLFLALLLEVIALKKAAGDIVSTILAVEEPEAHLHPHLQRVLFRQLLRTEPALLVTTHSTQIASVAPLRSLVILRSDGGPSVARGVSAVAFSSKEVADLERYVDATRADVLFARGVVLVEGPSELYVLPAVAESLGFDLDALGIAVCSVHGTDFLPYVKLVGPQGFAIPFVVVTDGDSDPDKRGSTHAGFRRGLGLMRGAKQKLRASLAVQRGEYAAASKILADEAVYVGDYTLEVDLAIADPESTRQVLRDLARTKAAAKALSKVIDDVPVSADARDMFMSRVERLGKGRFAQRVAPLIEAKESPGYIVNAVRRIIELTA